MARGSSSYTARSIRRGVSAHITPDLNKRADKDARVFNVLFTDVRTGISLIRAVWSHSPAYAVEVAWRQITASEDATLVDVDAFTNITVARCPNFDPRDLVAPTVDETLDEQDARRRRWRQDHGVAQEPGMTS